MEKLPILVFCMSTLALSASEAPKQLSMGNQSPIIKRDSREIQVFDDCTNEECLECCRFIKNVICNPCSLKPIMARYFPCIDKKRTKN